MNMTSSEFVKPAGIVYELVDKNEQVPPGRGGNSHTANHKKCLHFCKSVYDQLGMYKDCCAGKLRATIDAGMSIELKLFVTDRTGYNHIAKERVAKRAILAEQNIQGFANGHVMVLLQAIKNNFD